jgi:hypothetical protein
MSFSLKWHRPISLGDVILRNGTGIERSSVLCDIGGPQVVGLDETRRGASDSFLTISCFLDIYFEL